MDWAALRLILFAFAAAPLLSGHAWASSVLRDGVEQYESLAERRIYFETDEATWVSVDVSPNGEQIVFDMLGDLYLLPVEGGRAVPLRKGGSFDTKPKFSPDGRTIAFISDLDGGTRQVWLMSSNGSDVRLAGIVDRDVSSFDWTRSGSALTIVRSFDIRADRNELIRLDLATGKTDTLGAGTNASVHISSADKPGSLYMSSAVRNAGRRNLDLNIYRYDRIAESRSLIVNNAFAAKISPDSRHLAFARYELGLTSLWVKDLATGDERKLHDSISKSFAVDKAFALPNGLIPNYAFTPDSREIIITVDGKIYRIEVETGKHRLVPFVAVVNKVAKEPFQSIRRIDDELQAKQLRWIDIAADERTIAVGAVGKVWIGDMVDGAFRSLISGENRQNEPVFSPGGERVAYTTWSDHGARSLMVASVKSGETRLVHQSDAMIAHPRWSPNGKDIAFTEVLTFPCLSQPEHDLMGVQGSLAQLCVEPDTKVDWVRVGYRSLLSGVKEIVDEYVVEAVSGRSLHSSIVYSEDGRTLYFSRMNTAATGQVSTEIKSIDLDTGSLSTVFVIPVDSTIEFAIPAPNGKRFAISGVNGLWVLDVDDESTMPFSIDRPQPSDRLRRIGPHVSHALWLGSSRLVWMYGNQLFQWEGDEPVATNIGKVALTIPTAEPKGLLALTNARIVTMSDDQVLEKATLLVDGNRIIAVATEENATLPKDSRVLDASGMTIIPGIVDTHAHPHGIPSRKWEFDLDQNLAYLANLAWGVTTLFDPQASSQDAIFSQAEMISVGELIGPRVYATGKGIFSHSTQCDEKGVTPETEEQLRQIVRDRAVNGAIFVKSYSIKRRDCRQKLVEIATQLGLSVTTEGGGRQSRQLSHFLDGHTAVEHNLAVSPLYRDVVEYMAQAGTVYTPSLPSAYGSIEGREYFGSRQPASEMLKARRFERSSFFELLSRYGGTAPSYTPDREIRLYDIARSLRRIVDAGGTITIGSHDSPAGITAHWDMWLMQLGGMTPTDVLRAATINGAVKLGLNDDLGTIEVGKLADFVVLNCNPLADIRCTADIEYTVANGVVYHADSMTQMWPEYKPMKQPYWHSDEVWEEVKPELPEPWEGVPFAESLDLTLQ